MATKTENSVRLGFGQFLVMGLSTQKENFTKLTQVLGLSTNQPAEINKRLEIKI